jgi:hypothetical protein
MNQEWGVVMANYQDTLGMEYVYVSETTNQFLHAQISIIVGDDDTDIYIRPQQMITCGELNTIFDYLNHDVFKKLKMHVSKGCTAYVIFDGVTYDVELDNGVAVAINDLDPL